MFRYRAWEKAMEEMIPVESINFLTGVINGDSAWRTFDEIDLMRSTGRFDVTGKVEVFEGDIVRFLRDGIITHGVVQFSPRTLAFVVETIGRGGGTTLLFASLVGVSVVGNIYENEELLNSL